MSWAICPVCSKINLTQHCQQGWAAGLGIPGFICSQVVWEYNFPLGASWQLLSVMVWRNLTCLVFLVWLVELQELPLSSLLLWSTGISGRSRSRRI